jgi:NAD-dependent deacetylase
MELENVVGRVATAIREFGDALALTGAGISVESGVPDFRSPGGIWERFDPMEYAHIDAFRSEPERVWVMLRELDGILDEARPNSGHIALAELERLGYLKAVITQNIDNLHQEAGSGEVIEFHGNGRWLRCIHCGIRYGRARMAGKTFPPHCSCGEILKPDVVFFGEAIPREAMLRSVLMAQTCRVLLVVGTSATVAPASQIPFLAKHSGALIAEFNTARTLLTSTITDFFVEGPAGTTLPILVDTLKELSGE